MMVHRLLTAAHALKTLHRNADDLLDRLHVQACEGDTSDCYDNDPNDVPNPASPPRREDPETMGQDPNRPSTAEDSSLDGATTLAARVRQAFAGPLTAALQAMPA